MVRDILLQQKRELEKRIQEPYVQRDLGAQRLSEDLVNVVLGPRRSGKSFFAMHALQQEGSFGYANFDDERLVDLTDYDELIAALDSVYGNPTRLLLDEIQNVPRWELLVNRLQRQERHLTVTGSNAHLLSTELTTHLTGRHLPVILFPFSFPEYLRSMRKELTASEQHEALHRYAEEGGYPEPLVKNIDRGPYLSTLVHSILYKDIVMRFRIRLAQGMEDLTQYLMSNVANEYSFQRLTQVTRCRSVHTVEKYLGHLQEALLFFSLRRFSFKVREQVRANRKVYCVDNGLITSAGFRFSANRGALYENLVAVALHKRQLRGEARIFFWKNPRGEEVDFVVQERTDVTSLIQVCADVSDQKTREREIRPLLKAGRDLRCANLLVLTENTEEQTEEQWHGFKGTIRFMPLWKWLLSQP